MAIVNVPKAARIMEHFGIKNQKIKTAEELSELQTIILQDLCDTNKNSKQALLAEVADVYVMLKQLELIYEFDSRDIDPIIEYKLERTLTKIDQIPSE